MVPGLNHVLVVWFVSSCYPDSASSSHLHGFDGLRIHPYNYSLHRKDLTHFIYIQDGSVIQSEVVPGLNHVIVVWFVPSCYQGSARSTHLHSFDGLRIHPYNYSLHCNLFKHFMYIYNGSVIQSEMVPGLNHAILVWFVPSC